MSLDCLHLLPDWLPSGERARLVAWASGPRDGDWQQAVCAVGPAGTPPAELLQTDWRVLRLPTHVTNWSRYRALAQLLKETQPRRIALWNLQETIVPWLCRWAAPQATWWASFNRASNLPNDSLLQRWLWRPLRQAWTELPSETRAASYDIQHWPLLAVGSKPDADFDRAAFRAKWRARHQLTTDAKLLLTVGPLTMDKRIHEQFWSIEQASNVVPNMHLFVLGTGPDLTRLRHYARLYHIESQIHFIDDVTEVTPYYHAADLYLSTDLRPELSWAIRTAIGAGCPVIAPDRPWHRAVIQPRVTGDLVNEKYPAELSRGIVRWFEHHGTNEEQPVLPLPSVTTAAWSEVWHKCESFADDFGSERASQPSSFSAASSPL